MESYPISKRLEISEHLLSEVSPVMISPSGPYASFICFNISSRWPIRSEIIRFFIVGSALVWRISVTINLFRSSFWLSTLIISLQAPDDRLLTELSRELRKHKIGNTGCRQLWNYLSFYLTYPQIVRTVPAQSRYLIPALPSPAEKVRHTVSIIDNSAGICMLEYETWIDRIFDES